jgi:hypothetical protein
MARADEYRILRANLKGPASKAGGKALERLVAEENQLLRDGWQVSGPLVGIEVTGTADHVLYQPMLKPREMG